MQVRGFEIPAIAAEGVPDALGRSNGVAMTSAMGRTREQFNDLRRSVGERTWHSLYQGVPANPEGGLVKAAWINDHRTAAAPPHPTRTVVAVDPADSGERDAAGLIAASLTRDGRVHLIADQTAKMTSDEWARAAIALALDVGASEIHVEAFAAGTTYVRIVREALERTPGAGHITVKAWPPKGQPRKGDDVARAAPMLQALETGRCVIAGPLTEFEQAALQWQAGQHQPDAMAAAVIAFNVLAPTAGQRVTFASPLDLTRRITTDGGPDRSLIDHLDGRAPAVSRISQQHRQSVHGGGGYDPMGYPTRTISVARSRDVGRA